MCWTHRAQPGGRGRGARSEADWSKQRFGSLNKTFVCDWGFVMWTAWPVLLGVSEQPARHPRRNRSIPLPADPQPIHIAWEQIFLTTWVIDLYKAQMFSLCAEASSEWHKLPLIKFLTIHGKWVSSVNTVQMVLVWGLLGNKAPAWVNIWRKHCIRGKTRRRGQSRLSLRYTTQSAVFRCS